jgi:hypothetical protein
MEDVREVLKQELQRLDAERAKVAKALAALSGFTVYHVAGGLIHILLVLAVISLIMHFVLGRRTV